ncbi:Astacin [Trichostrongylus colubriformis]|uniref:Metalloendopeptidase n=1 Tax=Trichostrongylus colubriformis TaxID=6319 RepID=A0AAN8F8K1_TRICO
MSSMQNRSVAFVAIVSLLLLFLNSGHCLSANARISLTKALGGIDLEKRLERLRNLRVEGVVGTNANSMASPTNNIGGLVAPSAAIEGSTQAVSSTADDLSIVEANHLEGIDEYLFGGDIMLTEEQLAELERNQNNSTIRQKRQATRSASALWPNKKVFYFFDAGITDTLKALVRKALHYITVRTCLTFVENPTATYRIRVINGSGCWSFVGKIGQQDLSLGSGCGSIATIVHEFMHALGFYHSQMRHDRDSFITVNLSVVPVNPIDYLPN